MAAVAASIATAAPLAADVPWQDAPVRVEGAAISVARLGLPDPRISQLGARRASARRRAEARAREALHAFVDESLTRIGGTPLSAEAAHNAVDAHARVTAVRGLVDGGAVVVLQVERAELRRAVPLESAPW